MAYYRPPDVYRSPSKDGCKTCREPVYFAPVVDGYAWKHVRDTDHEVVPPCPWWDTATGERRVSAHVTEPRW